MHPFAPKAVVLGCISGKPTEHGGTCGLLVEYSYKCYLLYDCPEGTYVKILKHGIPLTCIHYIVISHMHPDHMSGLLTLLNGIADACKTALPAIYGPPALTKYLEMAISLTDMTGRFTIPLQINTIDPCRLLPNITAEKSESWSLVFFPLAHRIECYGIAMIRDELSIVDISLALSSGVPLDKLPELKRGIDAEKFTRQCPRMILMLCSDNDAERLLQDHKYAGIDDMTFSRFLDEFCLHNPDFLLHEYTFMNCHSEKARLYGHSYTNAIGTLCDLLHPKRVLLTHFSVRYRREKCSREFGAQPPNFCIQFQEWHKSFGKIYPTVYATEDQIYTLT